MSLLGPDGLAQVASASLANTPALRDSLASLACVEAVFSASHFHETVIRLPQPVASLLERLAAVGIFGGFDTSVAYPERGQAMMVGVPKHNNDEKKRGSGGREKEG